MKDKILKELKTKYSHLGFSAEVLEGVATQLSSYVTKEEEIANAVSGAENMLKGFQSFADGRVAVFKTETAKHKTQAEEFAKKIAELKKTLKEGKAGNESERGEVPAYIAAMQETLKVLGQNIATLKSEKVNETLKSQFVGRMDELKIPKTFYETAIFGREFKDAEQLNTFIETVRSGYETHSQYLADNGFKEAKAPEEGGNPKGEEEERAAIIDEILKESETDKN